MVSCGGWECSDAKRVAAASKVISYADRTLTKANRQFMAAAVRHATNNSAMSIKFNQRGQCIQAVLIFEPFDRSRPSRAPAAQTRPDAPPDVPPARPDIDTSDTFTIVGSGKRRAARQKAAAPPKAAGPPAARTKRLTGTPKLPPRLAPTARTPPKPFVDKNALSATSGSRLRDEAGRFDLLSRPIKADRVRPRPPPSSTSSSPVSSKTSRYGTPADLTELMDASEDGSSSDELMVSDDRNVDPPSRSSGRVSGSAATTSGYSGDAVDPDWNHAWPPLPAMKRRPV